MKLTKLHTHFWMSKKLPEFFIGLAPQVSIDDLIPNEPPFRTEPHNTLAILRMYRKRSNTLVPKLYEMAFTTYNDVASRNPRRRAYCRKWLNRIQKGRYRD